ncbi:hypothetical protein [Peterkaempfera griseoplana]|uniref:hypothetical protein n=1 Tax=Peterkaempfera griseoplana TaxID=66896 RepID=UPI000B04A8EA|nr:hypothetical protein [Peterkaempfera griseoplana]
MSDRELQRPESRLLGRHGLCQAVAGTPDLDGADSDQPVPPVDEEWDPARPETD